MALDIAILGTDGRPTAQVSIGVDDHNRLLELIDESGGHVLSRLHDYYADTEFGGEELDSLIRGAIVLRDRSDDSAVTSFLNALIRLAESAKSEHRPLTVIAD